MILRGTPATIAAVFLSGDSAADPGVVQVTVHRGDGTELVGETPASGSGAAARTLDLTAEQTQRVDRLTATWVSSTHGTLVTHHRIVGNVYATLAALRDAKDLGDDSKFPDHVLAAAHDWWADLVDDYCQVSFIPTYRLERMWYAGGGIFLDRAPVRAFIHADFDGSDLTVDNWSATPNGRVQTTTPITTAAGTLTVGYEHGHDAPDQELYEAGLVAMRSKLLTDRSGPASRQTLISNQLGTVRLAQPGHGRATGIPEVDAVLNRRRAEPLIV